MAEKTYTDAEIAQKIKDADLNEWYLEEGWLRASTPPTAGRPRSC